MEFHLSKDKNPELILEANNLELDQRWILRNPGFFIKNEVGNSVKAFVNTMPKDKKLQRTRIYLGEDHFIDRTVLVKTVYYNKRELDSADSIKMKRRMLKAQVEILNAVSSNMLPEPLDYFEVTNHFDDFDKAIAEEFQKTEPVLILDFIPGDVLADKLQNSFDKSFYRTEDGVPFTKKTEQINIGMIMRLAGDILAFEMELYEKGYAYTALSPDHIVLLGDNKPRFIGIGRICPVNADRFDCNHINFGRQLKGYSAPEFNQRETGFGMNAGVKPAIVYNLGVLIVSIILSKTEFDEKQLVNGAYDYSHAEEDRNAVRKAGHGQWLDSLLCRLTECEPSKRLTDFEQILQEFAVISGDARRESQKDTIYHGTVKFFARDKGFGFVTSGGIDYYVPLLRAENAPDGYEGQAVSFTVEKDRSGKDIVRSFVIPPRTDVKYPKFIKKPDPVVPPVRPQPRPAPKPRPIPQPAPDPVPAPQKPKKKGFLSRLFGR